MKEVNLPSGVKLEIGDAGFDNAWDLYQAILDELRRVHFDAGAEIDADFFKNIFCATFSTKKIELLMRKCAEKSRYDGVKFEMKLFDDVKARGDYLTILLEVTKEHLMPFTKDLYALFKQVTGMMPNFLA